MDNLLSVRQIDQLVVWGGKFLRATSTKPEIMQLMLGLGYSDAEHKTGWDLYLKLLGYRGAGAAPAPISMNTTDQLHALAQIDHYDEPAFRRSTAALERLHPEQHRYLFAGGLVHKTGPESVGSVQTFLDRYAALRDGTDSSRVDQRQADEAAARTLESRNIVNPKIEQELRQLIEIVKRPAPLPTPIQMTATEEARQNAALTFATWLRDWRTTASAGIRRRDLRIILGISKRKTSAENGDDVPDPVPAPSAKTAEAHP
jgi:hypothetical protein